MSETSSNEQDRSQVVLKACSMGKRLMIIELGEIHEAEDLHIETRTGRVSGTCMLLNGIGEYLSLGWLSAWGWKRRGCEQDTGH